MSDYCLVTTTFDNIDEANKVRDILMEKRLIASGGITQMDSKCFWKEKIEHTSEFYLQMLTKKNLYNEIKDEIQNIHSYELCGILMYDITNGNEEFLKWIDNETRKTM